MITTHSSGGEKYESTPLDELADSGMIPEDDEEEEKVEEVEEVEETEDPPSEDT